MSESPPRSNGAHNRDSFQDEEHFEIESLRERLAELERERGDSLRARDELLEQRISANALLNASTDSLAVLDPLGTILAINDAGSRRFGADVGAIRGRSVFDFLDGEACEHMRHWLKEAVETQKTVQFKIGTDYATYGYRLTPSSEPGTNAVRVALLIRDISENERTLMALRESEARYRGILEDQTELICRYLPDGRLSYVNEAYARHFGKTPRELINTNFIPHIPEEDVVLIRSCIAGLSPENPVTSFEHRVILDNGEVHWHHWTHRAIYNAHNELVEY
ncbi:MAG: PAS domain-containing protein, partial [Oceanidesulfovibrio sp.]